MADLATSPFSTTLSDTLTIRTGLAGRRAVPRRLNVTHSQHADSAQQIYSSTVSALAVFLAMNRPTHDPVTSTALRPLSPNTRVMFVSYRAGDLGPASVRS